MSFPVRTVKVSCSCGARMDYAGDSAAAHQQRFLSAHEPCVNERAEMARLGRSVISAANHGGTFLVLGREYAAVPPKPVERETT